MKSRKKQINKHKKTEIDIGSENKLAVAKKKKESTFNAGASGSIPRLGRSPREGIGYPL